MTSHVMLDGSHMGNTWDLLEIISWSMTNGELRRWIYTGAYPFYQWWIFRGDMIYTGAYPAHRWQFLLRWCLALGHSQFLFGSWWIRSCGMILHWSIAILESAFIRDTITLLDIPHCDTLHSLMVDFWDDLFWGIAFSSMMDFDLSCSIDTSDGLY